MKKTLSLLLSLALLISLLTGCTFGNTAGDNNQQAAPAGSTQPSDTSGSAVTELTFNAKTEPPNLDPLKATDTTSFWILDHLGEGLYTTDKDGNVVLGAAKEVKVSDDLTKYTFTLRDDAKWSNGDPVTAEDFVYSFIKHLDPATGSTTAYFLYYIKNAEKFNKGEAKAEDVGIKALSDKTLELELEAPTSYIDKLLATRYFFPVNKKVAEANAAWAAEASTYVSNGAYKLVEWQHDSHLVIEKNEHYWNKDDVKASKITWLMVNDATTYYQLYKQGKLDLAHDLPPDVLAKEKSNPDFKRVKANGTYMFMFNVKQAPFHNPKIRKAFALAIDRKTITESVTQGGETPAYAMVPYGHKTPAGTDFREEGGDYFQEDIELAKQLLAEGLREENLASLPKIVVSYNTSDINKKVAQVVQEMLKKNLGVEVELESQEWKVYLDKIIQRNYQIGRMSWTGQVLDPSNNLDYYLGDSPNNNTNWINPEFDRLNAAARVEKDPNKRIELLHQAEKVLMEDMPFIPVYFTSQNYLVNPRIDGLVYPLTGYPIARWAEKK
ncbi:peptide ABC transporter substrate-binding protein [Brevibacillus marinus]|uniref:peptide ABC transporter substrate-binding protein n=1 Tax=Brevibacillus marinus TaxID=2496837 RepID=UPI000F8463BB|nr:peptide ABC transporter substrate-binding protein [Brevibacillus marinus]